MPLGTNLLSPLQLSTGEIPENMPGSLKDKFHIPELAGYKDLSQDHEVPSSMHFLIITRSLSPTELEKLS